MQIAYTKPGRESPQYVYSERDAKYLETQGWSREQPPKPVEVAEKRPRGRPVLRLKDKP